MALTYGVEAGVGTSFHTPRAFVNKEKIARLRERMERGEDVSREDRTVGYSPTPEYFTRWTDKTGIRADLVNNNIIVREFLKLPHSKAQTDVILQLGAQIRAAGIRYLVEALGPTNVQGRVNGDVYIPDVVVTVRGQSNIPLANLNGRFPVAVIEVGSSQSSTDLHQRASFFLGSECPSVIYYVGCKRFEPRNVGQAMVATLYQRAPGGGPNLTQVISFGTAALHHLCSYHGHALLVGVGAGDPPCNAPGIVMYQVNFAVPVLLASRVGALPPGVPAVLPANLTFDLFEVQEGFLEVATNV